MVINSGSAPTGSAEGGAACRTPNSQLTASYWFQPRTFDQLEITALSDAGEMGRVTTAATVHNQRGEVVLDGQHIYLLRR